MSITAYKGHDPLLYCMNTKYKIGQTYEQPEKPGVCDHGFHACLNPADVLNFYEMWSGHMTPNRFTLVSLEGETSEQKNYQNLVTKVATNKITILRELTLQELALHAVRFKHDTLTARHYPVPRNVCSDHPDACLWDEYNEGTITAVGPRQRIISTCLSTVITATVHKAIIICGGNYNTILSVNERAQIIALGWSTHIITRKNHAKVASYDGHADIYSGGDYAEIRCSGPDARIRSHGGSACIVAEAPKAVIHSFGENTEIKVTGPEARIFAFGRNTHIKAAAGTVITWGLPSDSDSPGRTMTGTETTVIGENNFKPDTWYDNDTATVRAR